MPAPNHSESFKQSFREEAGEIVVELQAVLRGLRTAPRDQELAGRAFRGLHTLKDSGEIFGFGEMAAFAQQFEQAFYAVCDGRLEITPDLLDWTNAALGEMWRMMEGSAEGRVADSERRSCLLEQLANLERKEAGESGGAAAVPVRGSETAGPGPEREWQIRYMPGPDRLRNGASPMMLINELRQLGTLAIKADLTGLPPLAEMDPERCYLRWEMFLRTPAAPESICDIFRSEAGRCEFAVEPAQPEDGEG